jgi:GNAT superfamily N-acetyltransferase
VKLIFRTATPADAVEIAALRNSVAADRTRLHGRGHWSSNVTEKGVLYNMRTSQVVIARSGSSIVATLQLATKKPWAIDTKYFTPVKKPLYLIGMAVAPGLQGKGVGRGLLEEAAGIARGWPSDAIRLDVYDAEAGAGGFYGKCGYREVGRVVYKTVPLIYFELVL